MSGLVADLEPLSYRQAQCLDVIAEHVSANTEPSRKHIAGKLSVSIGRVRQHVTALQRKGWLRSVRPLRPVDAWLASTELRHAYLSPPPARPSCVSADAPKRNAKSGLTPRQAEVYAAIEAFFSVTNEGCPVTYLAEHLNLHHETVRDHVAALFSKGLVLAPGSPVTPACPEVVPFKHHRLIYVVLDPRTRLVKIGQTGNLQDRFASLCYQQASPLIMIGAFAPYVPFGALSEAAWHRRFRSSHATGEWFRLTPDIQQELRARFGVDIMRILETAEKE